MCRFVLYLGRPIHLASLTTVPEHSLIHQSYASQEREEPLNGDGFGVVWYPHESHDEAALFRSITPAWNNQNLRHLARAIRSGCVLAHVRAASPGSAVNEANTHPFVAGRYAFMHNGSLAGFRDHRRSLMDLLDEPFFDRVEGTTDSECLFAHCLQILSSSKSKGAVGLAAALETAIALLLERLRAAGVVGESYVNVALSDGREAVVCRYTNSPNRQPASLHMHTGRLYTMRAGKPRLVEANEDEHSVIVASEPLTGDASWSIVPANAMVLIQSVHDVTIRPLSLGA